MEGIPQFSDGCTDNTGSDPNIDPYSTPIKEEPSSRPNSPDITDDVHMDDVVARFQMAIKRIQEGDSFESEPMDDYQHDNEYGGNIKEEYDSDSNCSSTDGDNDPSFQGDNSSKTQQYAAKKTFNFLTQFKKGLDEHFAKQSSATWSGSQSDNDQDSVEGQDTNYYIESCSDNEKDVESSLKSVGRKRKKRLKRQIEGESNQNIKQITTGASRASHEKVHPSTPGDPRSIKTHSKRLETSISKFLKMKNLPDMTTLLTQYRISGDMKGKSPQAMKDVIFRLLDMGFQVDPETKEAIPPTDKCQTSNQDSSQRCDSLNIPGPSSDFLLSLLQYSLQNSDAKPGKKPRPGKKPKVQALDLPRTESGAIDLLTLSSLLDPASLILPAGICYKDLTAEGGWKGIWTTTVIPKGTTYGPYGGSNAKPTPAKLAREWMRHVRHVLTSDQSNLATRRCKHELWYKTTRDLKQGEELLVWEIEHAFQAGSNQEMVEASQPSSSGLKDTSVKEASVVVPQESTDESANLAKPDVVVPESTSAVNTPSKTPYSCTHCGKCLSTNANLKKHLRKHIGGEKPFKCDQCPKRFFAGCDLRAHQRTHSGEKPFICSECGKGFAQSCQLGVHKRTHSTERPFECSDCQKRFYTFSNLQSHCRTHTGEKPYSCPICGRSFGQSGGISSHMRTHVRREPFPCDVCNKNFSTASSLMRHTNGDKHKAMEAKMQGERDQKFSQSTVDG